MTAKVIFDKSKNVLAALRGLAGRQVMVGIPAGENARGSDQIGNAQLGFIHEHGSPANNIPARPFLSVGVKASEQKVAAILRSSAMHAAEGNSGALDKGLNAAGLVAQAAVKNAIVSGAGFAPLKKGTLNARDRKGFKGTKPLIRTGQLLNSISYVVRDK